MLPHTDLFEIGLDKRQDILQVVEVATLATWHMRDGPAPCGMSWLRPRPLTPDLDDEGVSGCLEGLHSRSPVAVFHEVQQS